MTKQLAIIALLSFGAAACGSSSTNVNVNVSNTARADTTPVANVSNANVSPTANSNAVAPSANATPTETESTTEQGDKVVTVKLPAGKVDGSYSKSFAGYGYVDYQFQATKGQKLTTKVKSDGNDAILGVMRNDLMVAPGSTQVQDWSGELPEDGTYTIRVAQMRAEARRSDKPKNFTLDIKLN